ncbi:hypothetical protein JR316_0000006 [Psilocybe cubensis]|uniref:Uncharacterized protein n=1 Tax=Psilocybe cubensis TaxID=181762 RepID=A0ACB8HDD8_PSICU|nr:hypothetical protein JR316_0000006 [Psilocybe cubensis]KAH9485946.1 hypothetical protein JR316_0000006 [Psilocybe cubensis]
MNLDLTNEEGWERADIGEDQVWRLWLLYVPLKNKITILLLMRKSNSNKTQPIVLIASGRVASEMGAECSIAMRSTMSTSTDFHRMHFFEILHHPFAHIVQKHPERNRQEHRMPGGGTSKMSVTTTKLHKRAKSVSETGKGHSSTAFHRVAEVLEVIPFTKVHAHLRYDCAKLKMRDLVEKDDHERGLMGLAARGYPLEWGWDGMMSVRKGFSRPLLFLELHNLRLCNVLPISGIVSYISFRILALASGLIIVVVHLTRMRLPDEYEYVHNVTPPVFHLCTFDARAPTTTDPGASTFQVILILS